MAGGLLGNRMGSSLDCRDQRYHGDTAQNAFESEPSGTTAAWTNPDTGHRGTVTPTRTFQRNDGTNCREFQQTIVVDGQVEEGYGTACRQADGSWSIVSN